MDDIMNQPFLYKNLDIDENNIKQKKNIFNSRNMNVDNNIKILLNLYWIFI